MSIGAGIAILGIWLGVGISSFKAGDACVLVAFCAMIATIAVCMSCGG